MKPPPGYTKEQAVTIERHTDQHLAERKAQREKYRQARAERIHAGKTEPGDLEDPEDMVCPYCGEWASAGRHLAVVRRLCVACTRWFEVRCRVEYHYTSAKPE